MSSQIKSLFEKKRLQSFFFFLKLAVLLIDVIVSCNGFHRTSASWALPTNVEQLARGTDTKETVRRSEENS